ncbi:MAG: hypothetical protein ACI3XQ_11170, partial [Eubacteriales bacterium]
LPAENDIQSFCGENFSRKVFPAPLLKAFNLLFIYLNPKFLKEGRGEENFFQEVSSPPKSYIPKIACQSER